MGENIRLKYINKFVDSTHPQYQEQIEKKHKFIDGYCYLGYLWDYMKTPSIINKEYIKEKSKDYNYEIEEQEIDNIFNELYYSGIFENGKLVKTFNEIILNKEKGYEN